MRCVFFLLSIEGEYAEVIKIESKCIEFVIGLKSRCIIVSFKGSVIVEDFVLSFCEDDSVIGKCASFIR